MCHSTALQSAHFLPLPLHFLLVVATLKLVQNVLVKFQGLRQMGQLENVVVAGVRSHQENCHHRLVCKIIKNI